MILTIIITMLLVMLLVMLFLILIRFHEIKVHTDKNGLFIYF